MGKISMKILRLSMLWIALIGAFTGPLTAENYSYHAAGVLLYAHDDAGRTKILLGLSSVHGDEASDFGGLMDDIDRYRPELTAAREGCEELMFLFDSDSAFHELLLLRNKYKKNFDIAKAPSGSYKYLLNALADGCPYSLSEGYIMHFVKIPYQEHLPAVFSRRKSLYKTLYKGCLPHCWNETLSLVWADLDEVYTAIRMRASFEPITIKGCTLYEPFVKSLLVAESQKIILKIQF